MYQSYYLFCTCCFADLPPIFSDTHIIIYCPNFITASAVYAAYSPQLSLFFNYNCNIHMRSCSDRQVTNPTSSTFYTLIFCETAQQGSIKSNEWLPLLWDYSGPATEYKAKTIPLQKQGYINIQPVLAFVTNILPNQDKDNTSAQLIKSQLNTPPPVFFAYLLCLFASHEGFVVDINSTSPWPAIGAIHAAAPFMLTNDHTPTRSLVQSQTSL
jgi:hypothetical protein